MKIIKNIVFILLVIVAALAAVFCAFLMFELLTYLLMTAGVPISDEVYVIDDLLEIFFE
jgi:uncharacterized membrane protein YuzA (DUF378 family)